MRTCQACWNRGRSLAQGACICTGHVAGPTAFHKWNASRRINNFAKKEAKDTPPEPQKPKLVFGQKPPAKKTRKKRGV